MAGAPSRGVPGRDPQRGGVVHERARDARVRAAARGRGAAAGDRGRGEAPGLRPPPARRLALRARHVDPPGRAAPVPRGLRGRGLLPRAARPSGGRTVLAGAVAVRGPGRGPLRVSPALLSRVASQHLLRQGGRPAVVELGPLLRGCLRDRVRRLSVAPSPGRGIARHEREGAGFFPLLCGALILPHALYVAAIGGDHFEYRPLDLYFPLIFLLLYAGARHLARTPARAAAVAAYAGLVLFGLWEIPYQSHRQFIGSYQPGFPGVEATSVVEAQRFLELDRDPILRPPVLRVLASWHRDLVRHMTKFFVGVRQEEHRMFLATVIPEVKRLARLVERGILPRDAY